MSIVGLAESAITGNPLPLLIDGGKAVFGRLFRWLGSLNVWQIGCMAIAAFALVQHFELVAAHRHSRKVEAHDAASTKALGVERAAHAADIDRYRAAAEQARLADLANKHRVEASQDAITKDVSHDYQTKLADLRARYDRLRASTAGHQGGANPAPMPGVPGAAGGSDEGAAQDGLSLSDRLICSTNSLQLLGLQEWLRRQAAVVR